MKDSETLYKELFNYAAGIFPASKKPPVIQDAFELAKQTGDSYNELFERFKNELNDRQIKFAGSPLHKALLTAFTYLYECDRRSASFEDYIQELKNARYNGLPLTGFDNGRAVRVAFGYATKKDLQYIDKESILENSIKNINSLDISKLLSKKITALSDSELRMILQCVCEELDKRREEN